MAENNKRIAYVLKDYNTINPNEILPNEILLDYENEDFVIINSQGKPIKFKEYVQDCLKDVLTTDHMTRDNQHMIATDEVPGFMSPEYKLVIDEVQKIVAGFDDMLKNNIVNSKILINKFDYRITNRKLEIMAVVDNANHMESVVGIIDLGDRPTKNFMNIYNQYGYRNDLIYVECSPEEALNIKYATDIYYSDDKIILNGVECLYDKDRAVYNYDGLTYIVPIILINRRNNELVSETNINGKFSNNYISPEELYDISRRKLPNISYNRIIEIIKEQLANGNTNSIMDKTKIIKSNISYMIDTPKTLCYIPFNNNDMDQISGLSLNKNCTFKSSPFGKMMNYSEKEGDSIAIKNNGNEFKMDMLLDISNIDTTRKQTILSIYNPLLNDPLFKFQYIGNEEFSIEYKSLINKFNVSQLDKVINRYNMITIVMHRYNISVILNNNLVCTMNTDVDLSGMSNFKINSLTFPIGSVVVSSDVENTNNPYINQNVILLEKFNIASKNTILEYRELQFTTKNLQGISDDVSINIYTDGIKSNQIKQGSLIELNFGKELVYLLNPVSKINYINGNVITLNNNNIRSIEKTNMFKTGDNIIVSKDENGIESRDIYTIQFIQGDDLVLDRLIDSDCINYYVSNMANTTYVKLVDSAQEIIGNVGIRDNIVKIISKKTYTSDTPFKLYYIKKKSTSNIIDCIKDIENVLFDGNRVEAIIDRLIKNAQLTDTIINVNGEDITRPTKDIAIYKEDSINVKINYDLLKAINETSYVSLNNMLDISCTIDLYTNVPIILNGKFIYNDDFIRTIDVPVIINKDNSISININSEESDIELKELIITKLNISVKFKDGFNKIFTRKDTRGRILDYLIMCNHGLFSNVSPLNMTISQKFDNFEYGRQVIYLTDIVDGYRLVSDNNLIKVEQVDNGKIYRLDKYYVI